MDKKYQIIYADPPWDYGNTKNPRTTFWGLNDRHYPVMRIQEIKSLPISTIAEQNCYLFLWATSPFLEQAFDVIKSWGFRYCTVVFIWIKTKKNTLELRNDGIGKYTLSNAEYCLLGRTGKYWRNSRKVRQVILAPKQEHSRKPDAIRERIVELMGDLSRIELFARQKVDGWDCWGNEVESDIELK